MPDLAWPRLGFLPVGVNIPCNAPFGTCPRWGSWRPLLAFPHTRRNSTPSYKLSVGMARHMSCPTPHATPAWHMRHIALRFEHLCPNPKRQLLVHLKTRSRQDLSFCLPARDSRNERGLHGCQIRRSCAEFTYGSSYCYDSSAPRMAYNTSSQHIWPRPHPGALSSRASLFLRRARAALSGACSALLATRMETSQVFISSLRFHFAEHFEPSIRRLRCAGVHSIRPRQRQALLLAPCSSGST